MKRVTQNLNIAIEENAETFYLQIQPIRDKSSVLQRVKPEKSIRKAL